MSGFILFISIVCLAMIVCAIWIFLKLSQNKSNRIPAIINDDSNIPVSNEHKESIACPNCLEVIDASDKQCEYCGRIIQKANS